LGSSEKFEFAGVGSGRNADVASVVTGDNGVVDEVPCDAGKMMVVTTSRFASYNSK
jgi:hypothetical protein